MISGKSKMCTKRRRNIKQNTKSKYTISRNVSWTISDSDSEGETRPKKPNKVHNNKTPVLQITLNNRSMSPSLFSDNSDIENDAGINNRRTTEVTPLKLEPEQLYKPSPILGALNLGEQSPILTQNINKSPVISNRNIFKRIREIRRNLQRDRLEIEDPSTQSSIKSCYVISQVESEVGETQEVQIIDFATQLPKIKTEVSSDEETDVTIDSVSSDCNRIQNTVGSSSSTSTNKSVEKRRKTSIKNTLASELQKAIDAQRNSLALWDHRLFLKKNINICNEQSIVEFCFISKCEEFGCTVLHCRVEEEFCVIIVGLNIVCNVNFTGGCKYKLFPPYCIRNIIYKDKRTNCYYNCSRFINI